MATRAEKTLSGDNLLLIRNIPPILETLRAAVSLETLRVRTVGTFDPEQASTSIASHEGAIVTAFDIGGDKIARQMLQVRSGILRPITDIEIQKGNDGNTYLNVLQQSSQTPFVGISCAGLLQGTVLAYSPNARTFTRDLQERYDGDFAKLFPGSQVALDNDAVAGVKSAAVEAYRRNSNVKNVLFVINGGGFGCATVKKDLISGQWQIMASEPGHIELPNELNYFDQHRACGMEGAEFTCVEKGAIASGAAIEATYFALTGNKLDGRAISALYRQGDELATQLYDFSAIVLAQVLFLQMQTLKLFPQETTVVFHGGAFEVPGYQKRVIQVLEHYTQQSQAHFNSKEIEGNTGGNAGLLGAAIAALMIKKIRQLAD